MIHLVGSFKKRPFLELMEECSKEGSEVWSFMRLNFKSYDYELRQGFKIPSLERLGDEFKYDVPNYFYIGHIQTLPSKNIHPAKESGRNFLYLTGNLEPTWIRETSQLLKNDIVWEDQLFLEFLLDTEFTRQSFEDKLNKVKGEFSGIYIKKHAFLKIFGTETNPFFIDKEGTICSQKFEKSDSMDKNYIYDLDFENRKFLKKEKF